MEKLEKLENSNVVVRFREKNDIYARDLTDHYNEESCFTRKKNERDLPRAWLDIKKQFKSETDFNDVCRILSAYNLNLVVIPNKII